MKLRLPQRRLYRIMLYVISISLILLSLDLLLVRLGRGITIASDTTHITSPLRPDGYPDYIRYVDSHFSEGTTPDNNAALLLLDAFDPSTLPERVRNETYAAVRKSPPAPNQSLLVFYNEFLTKKNLPAMEITHQDADMDSARTRFWTPADYPLLAEYLLSQSHALDILHRAAQRPRYYFPLVASPGPDIMEGLFIPTVMPADQLAHAALARATLRAAAGDFDNAHADILDVHRLARLLAQQPTMLEVVEGVRTDTLASSIDALLAATEKLSAAQSRAYLADLAALPPMPTFEHAIDTGERLFCLDSFMFGSRAGMPALLQFVAPENASLLNEASAFYPVRFNPLLREVNRIYDDQIAALKLPTFRGRAEQLRAIHDNLDARYHASIPDPGLALLSIFNPSFVLANEREGAQRTQSDLARLALALSIYHIDHQAYPATLADLSPTYLPTLPEDLFIDQPLHYQPSPDHTSYLLYSVGPNMRDDAGHNRGDKDPAHLDADDLPISAPPSHMAAHG